jgi:general secretion pathway protein G
MRIPLPSFRFAMFSSPSFPSCVIPLPTEGERVAPVRRLRATRAFTLLEIIVVIGIMSILATLVITNLTKTLETSRTSVAKLFVTESMKTALTTYKIQMGDFPTSEQGLAALATAPAANADRWQGPYIEGKMPMDPWGRAYQYRYPGTRNKGSYDLWSMGADGVDGTDDDIGNW